MADIDDRRRDIEAQINKLSGDTARHYQNQLNTLNQNNASLSEFDTLLSLVNDRVTALSEGFSSIESQLTAIVSELKHVNTNSKDITKAFVGLRSIAQKLKYDQQGITDLNKDQLKQEKSKIKILQDQLKVAAELAIRKEQNGETLTEQEEAAKLAYQGQFSIIADINALLDKRIELENQLNKKLGATGVILGGLSKIPIAGQFLKTNEALDAAKTKAKEGGNSFQSMGAAFGSLGKNLFNAFSDPLVSIGLLIKAFKYLLELGFLVDKQVTSLQKSFALSKTSAISLRDSFSEIQNSTAKTLEFQERSLINQTSLVEAANQLGEAFGQTLTPSKAQLENQIMLTKQIGLSVEEANSLQQLAYQNNISVEKITDEAIKQTATYRRQTGIQLDNKKILQDVAKISGQLRLQYSNSAQQLTTAVVQATKLGFTLEKTKQIAEGLLNFEQSIENELSAELLIGRDLNLEQARLLALNGKSAEATALIAENMGGSAGFAAMNVIQQEELAKALNMTTDDLANSLIYQEQLNKLGREGNQQVTARIQELEKQGRLEEAQQLQRDISNGKSAKEALTAIDTQTRFNAAMEKLKLIVADFVDGPAQKLVDILTSMVDNASLIKNIFVGLAFVIGGALTLSFTKMIAQLTIAVGQAIAFAAAWAIANPMAAIGGLLVAGAVYTAARMYQARSVEDAAIAPDGGLIVSGRKGELFQLDKKDGIIAGPMGNGSMSSGRSGGGSNQPINITVNATVDDRVLASANATVNKKYSNEIGDSFRESGYAIS
jgi:hypothetical protein